jgi:hypothetical protein
MKDAVPDGRVDGMAVDYGMEVRYLYVIEWWEYEQALELPYGLPIVCESSGQPVGNTSDGLGGDA